MSVKSLSKFPLFLRPCQHNCMCSDITCLPYTANISYLFCKRKVTLHIEYYLILYSSFKWYKLQPDATVPMCNIRVDVHSAIWCTSLKGPKENLYHRYTFYVPDYLLRSFFCKIPMYLSLQGYTINSYILIESLKHHGSYVLSNFFYFQSKLKILTQKEMEKEYY